MFPQAGGVDKLGNLKCHIKTVHENMKEFKYNICE